MSSTVYDIKFSKQLDVPQQTSVSTGSKSNLNLYNLLTKLGDPSVTTVDQRFAIRQVMTDFLNNDITSAKLFVFLNQILGYNILESIINSLSKDDTRTADPKTSSKLAEDKEDLRQRTRILRSVYSNFKWIAIPHYISCNTYGHKLCLFENNCLIFGGQFFKDITFEKDIHPTFERIRQINKNFLTTKLVDTSYVNCPPTLIAHTAVISSYETFPYAFVYGGFQPVNSETIALNPHFYGLNLTTHSWSILTQNSKIRPPARHSHAGVSYPYGKLPFDKLNEIEFFIVYGGIGVATEETVSKTSKLEHHSLRSLKILNDLWLFDIKNFQWIQIQLNVYPSARFGLEFSYISSNVLVLYGGETVCESSNSETEDELTSKHAALGIPPGKTELLGDTWLLVLNKIKNVNELFSVSWQLLTEDGPPRAHYAAVALTVPVEPNLSISMQNATPSLNRLQTENSSDSYYRVVFYISGLAQNVDGVVGETPSILIGLFHVHDNSKVSVQYRTITLDDSTLEGAGFQGRRNHSAVFFQAPAESTSKFTMRTLIGKQKLDINRKSRKSEKEAAKEEYVKHPEGEVDGIEDDHDKACSDNNGHEAVKSTSTSDIHIDESMVKFEGDHRVSEFTDTLNLKSKRKHSTMQYKVPCIMVCGGVWGENCPLIDVHILNLSAIYPQFNLDRQSILKAFALTGVQCIPPSLSSLFNFPTKATADFEEDASAENIAVNAAMIEKVFQYQPYQNIHPPLYQTGISIPSGIMWSLSTLVKHPFTALGHFIDNAMDALVNAKNISVSLDIWHGVEILQIANDRVGLSYQTLHILLKRFGQSSEDLNRTENCRYGLGFKLGVGRLSHNALVLTKSTTLYGVGLFSTHLNSTLGSNTFSCPINCWAVNDGLPIVDEIEEADFAQSLQLILMNSPLKSKENLKKEFEKFGSYSGTRIILFDLRKDIPHFQISSNHHFCVNSFSHKLGLPSLVMSHLPSKHKQVNSVTIQNFYGGFEIHPVASVILPETFPLYKDASSSLDYNAATYLFWAHLHSSSNLYINGTLLQSNRIEGSYKEKSLSIEPNIELININSFDQKSVDLEKKLSATDLYKYSLWRFLQNNLYNKLEFPFLIDPQYGDKNFYGIIGFLNNPKKKPTVCETDMPDFFAPRATKEGFIFDSDVAIQNVYDKLEKAIKEYLSVCHDAEKLEELQIRYISQFDAFRERSWNERKRSYLQSSNDQSPTSLEQSNIADSDLNMDSNALADSMQQSEGETTGLKGKRRRRIKEDEVRNLRSRRKSRYRNRKGDDELEGVSLKHSQSEDGGETQ